MDRRRFLLGAAPAVLGAGVGAVAVAAPAGSTTAAPRPWTKARRGVALGVQRILWSAPPGLAALTFDDGPYPPVTPTVLDVLDRYGIPGTFLCCGAFAEAHQDLVRAIVDRGHAIGNHTWTHRDMSRLDATEVRDELHRTHDVLSRFSEIRFYRPPRGQLSGLSIQVAAELGYDVLLWSAEELEPIVSGTLAVWHDGLGRGGFLPSGDGERVRRHHRRVGEIAQLPAAIERALDAGVRFVPASSLVK